ncbi:MAG: hybrid sensor histidine kinase/response regulator [Rhodocyclaceae bacterium]|jgi:signal transduction histidine kinase/ActR/RegA family two-component response regulator|nr:hybrid sensor histidine kinase/response regulator [Rhodocyclaceae bacterium]
MTLPAFASADERAVVEAEQIRAFYREANDQNLAGAIVVSLIAYVLHDGIPLWTWLPALLVLYVITALRFRLFRLYRREPGRYSTADWGRSQTIAGALAGVCWGFANTAMLAHVPAEGQFFILTVITVAAASSSSEGFSYTPPSQAYIVLSLCPPILWLLTGGDRVHTILAVLLTVFLPMTLLQGRKRNHIFIEAQQLRFRNEKLAGELKLQRDAAEEAYQAKARFLAAASHDLRQPMQALSIYHELLRHELEAPGQRGGELVANARHAADAMNTLLDALLDVSRLDAHVITPAPRPFPLQALLDDMQREFAPVAAHKGLQLRIRPSAATIVSDPVLLGQVLRNLLSNALRYTPSGGILVGARKHGDGIGIGVFDTGIGIAPEEHRAIFAEFYQVGNKARDRKHGIGLGLAIVERVVHLLGHRLVLRSEPGRGSCFAVTVPLAPPGVLPQPAAAPEVADMPDMHDALAGRHVLVVDDEEAIRDGMRRLLQGWGCRVTTAATFAEAMDDRADGIEAIVSDLGLPGTGNGIDLIAGLRQRHGTALPALLVTGDTGAAALQAARAAGIVMLHKPIRAARLRAALSAALEQPVAEPDG